MVDFTLAVGRFSEMELLHIRFCSIKFESYLTQPALFESVDHGALARGFLEEFGSYGMLPTDIKLDRGDGLFAFSLEARLFSDLATFRLNSSRIEASFSQINRDADRQIAHQCLVGMFMRWGSLIGNTSDLEIGVHAGFESAEKRDSFLKGCAVEEYETGGRIAYRSDSPRSETMRVEIDQSWSNTDSIFIRWRFSGLKNDYILQEKQIWKTIFETLHPFGLKLQTDEAE